MQFFKFIECLLLGHRDNCHKYLRPLLCWLGAHDYEVEESHYYDEATLKCFYCDTKKHSVNLQLIKYKSTNT